MSADTEAGLGNGLTLFQLEPSGVHEVEDVVSTQCSFIACVQLQALSSNGVTSTWYVDAPATGSQASTGVPVVERVADRAGIDAGVRVGQTLSRRRRFFTVGAVVGGTFANVCVNVGPRFQRPALSEASIARTRQ